MRPPSGAETLATSRTVRGELALRRTGGVLELISNGTFLMDTSSGASERALAELALAEPEPGMRVLIGGLGFGFTLAAALDLGAQVTVVEIEQDVVDWNRTWWPPAAAALANERTTIVVDDFTAFIEHLDGRFDAVLLDIDNGPDWTVTAANARLYAQDGVAALRRVVTRPHGRLAVWSANESEAFRERLAGAFDTVQVHRLPVTRGEPDVVYLASGSRP